jgi:hypothetical protein
MVSLDRENFPGRNDQDRATPPSGILRVSLDMKKFPHNRVSAAIKSITFIFLFLSQKTDKECPISMKREHMLPKKTSSQVPLDSCILYPTLLTVAVRRW